MKPFLFLNKKSSFQKVQFTTSCLFILVLILLLTVVRCSTPPKTYIVKKATITESVYASGNIESMNQYQLYPTVNGVIESIFVTEGAFVKKGQKILKISNEIAQLSMENSAFQMNYNRLENNKNKLKELQHSIEVAASKSKIDSAQFQKNKVLFENDIITSTELNNSELLSKNSKSTYYNLKMQLEDVKKQLQLNDQLSKTAYSQTKKTNSDYVLKSEISGEVFTLLKKKGELVTPQTLLGVMGNHSEFKLKLQIDEYDIVKIKIGQQITVKLDSYKGTVFLAKVTKIIPYMNERSKTFTIEGSFVNPPPILYPNLTFEATILIRKKSNVLVIPRELLFNEHYVIDKEGKKHFVKIGLKDYNSVEILSGISEKDALIYPNEN